MAIKKIQIDQNLCIGCGNCQAIAPKAFELKDGKFHLKENWQEETEENIKSAKEGCPVQAIFLIEE
ncbi:MAG: ferredoxin [Candidatus Pacebacteria bacterium]|nr:ferredoxin [Candidatus Paceibacterota bacterium]